jgi:hypothetical protein
VKDSALNASGYLFRRAVQAFHHSLHMFAGCVLQVSLLASGRLMYHGGCAQMMPWFQSIGYAYTRGKYISSNHPSAVHSDTSENSVCCTKDMSTAAQQCMVTAIR